MFLDSHTLCEYVMNEAARRSMSEHVPRSPAHDDHNASRWKVRWRVSEAISCLLSEQVSSETE